MKATARRHRAHRQRHGGRAGPLPSAARSGWSCSLTDGLVSPLRRRHRTKPLPDIQTTAPISPGSSGGGLFDASGRLIGVTVAIASKETDNLAFAYPAQWVMELPARVTQARQRWLAALAANGVALGADGEPATSGFAAIANVAAVPSQANSATGVSDAYKAFLLLDKPRAFVITSDGRLYAALTDARRPGRGSVEGLR